MCCFPGEGRTDVALLDDRVSVTVIPKLSSAGFLRALAGRFPQSPVWLPDDGRNVRLDASSQRHNAPSAIHRTT